MRWKFAVLLAALASLAPLSAYADVNLATPNLNALSNGLVGYWPLDGNTTNWNTDTSSDASGHGNTGTLANLSTTSSPVLGKIGQALKFNGTNQYIALPSALSSGLNSFTISFWVKTSDAASNSTYYQRPTLFGQQTTGFGSQDFGVVISGGDLGMWSGLISGDNTVLTSHVIDNNTWHHVVVTYNGATVYLYLDGTYTGSSLPSTLSLNSNAFDIGASDANGTAQYFASGTIDDVRFYNRALSAQEVQMLYELGSFDLGNTPASNSSFSIDKIGTNSGLVGYWPLDGNTTNWKTDTTSDVSGNADTGTLINMSTTSSPVLGKIGSALMFNSSTAQEVSLGTAPAALVFAYNQPFSISLWAKPSASVGSGTYDRLFSIAASSGQFEYFILANNNELSFNVGKNAVGDISVNSPYTVGQWYHVVGVYDGANVNLYINGAKVGSAAYTYGALSSPSGLVSIGGAGGTNTVFNGTIDDVRVYNRALSAQEITDLYTAGGGHIGESDTALNTGINAGLVGYWTFDGGTINWNAKTIADVSGQGETLTMVGYDAATTTAPTLGKIGQALKFNGSSQDLSHSNISALNFGTGDFSVSFWMKPTSPWGTGTTEGVLGQKTGDTYNGWQIYQDSGHAGDLDMRLTQQNNFLTASTVPTGVWTYATFVRKNGNTYWYLNGVLNASGSNSNSISDTGSFYIGYAPSWTAYYTGALDDVRIYGRALSAQEVKELYQMGI